MKNLLWLIVFISASALAAGKGSGNVTDLTWPAFNFIVLATFLIFKLKSPLAEHFKSKSVGIQETVESAKKKSEQAEKELKELEGKISNLAQEEDQVISQATRDAQELEKIKKTDLANRLERIKSDGIKRADMEKLKLSNKLSDEIVNMIVEQAKNKIVSSNKSQEVGNKMIQGLR